MNLQLSPPTNSLKYHLLSGILIILLCLGLFYLDHETTGIHDLFKPGNLIALALYVIPTYLLCFALYVLFGRFNVKNRMASALLLGIPLGFTLMMVILYFGLRNG